MFILKPTLVEEEIKQKIDFYKEAITKNGGEIKTCLDMGMRNLAYEIKKHQRGYYFVIYFTTEPKAILELERLYRINEDILRFIVIKYESKKEQKAWQTLVDTADKKIEPVKLSAPKSSHRDRSEEKNNANSQSHSEQASGLDSMESSQTTIASDSTDD